MNETEVIAIGLGANLPGAWGGPRETLLAALDRLAEEGVTVLARSGFWRTRPVPVSDQPWFVNAVALVATAQEPEELLATLHRVEEAFGRVRAERNAPRTLDLDLLAYGDRRRAAAEGGLVLPHPRLRERAFVLLPLRQVAPDWRHPLTGEGLEAMIARLPADQLAEPEA